MMDAGTSRIVAALLLFSELDGDCEFSLSAELLALNFSDWSNVSDFICSESSLIDSSPVAALLSSVTRTFLCSSSIPVLLLTGEE